MDMEGSDRWQAAQSQSLLWVGVHPETGYSQSLKSSPCSLPGRGRKSGRATRIRSKQRESASEKEKLRMRDLTKALHHLRSYLPPSVAPAGQTLTKIETLRLTIRYISYLSAQLGISEEMLFQRREQGDTSCQSQNTMLHYAQNCSFGADQYSRQHSEAPQDTILQLPPTAQPSCQMCGKDFCTPLVPRQYWG
uniref:BHLH domain-containing protein n=1 Tax=Monopterus albus TaxID=43700 RepID=A0A3Q3IMP0_MONAL